MTGAVQSGFSQGWRRWHRAPTQELAARTDSPEEEASYASARRLARTGHARRCLPAQLPGPARGAGLAAWAAAPLLEACAPALAGHGHGAAAPARTTRSPGRSSTDNKAIASGLQPEQDATLQVYNWVAYVNPACLKHFAKKYNCKVQVTTFNTMNEAMAKLRSGLSFDVFMGVTVDVLGQLIETKLIQPLNHSYIPNITQAWPDFTNPFYDQGWQYTVAVHDLHHRHRVAEGPGAREPVHDGATRGRCPGSRSTRARSRSWTTTARASAWA